jgi:hypothetical protein
MWKTNVKMNLYYANTCKHEHEQGYGVTSCLRLILNKLKEMKAPISIFPFGDLTQRSFQGGFYVCIK